MSKKNKSTPLRKEKLHIANHFNALVKAYVGDEAQRKTIMEAFLQKKPKSYAQINYPLYRFNTLTLGVLHLISFICAVSIVGYLMTLPIGGNVYALSIIAVLFLMVCEFGQHSTLNVAFENWHATNTVPQRIIMACIFFSLISIMSSAYGTYHFAQTYQLPTNAVLVGMIALSGINEILILYTTLEIHKYQKTVFQESVLVNDMHFQNSHSLFFDGMPNVQRMSTVLLDAEETPLPSGESKQVLPFAGPSIVVEKESTPYARNRPVTPDSHTAVTTAKKVKKAHKFTGNNTSSKSRNTAKTPVITKDSEGTATKKETTSRGDKKDWSFGDDTRNIRIYQGRVEKHKEGGTPSQKINLAFFSWIRDTHDFERNKTYPYTSPTQRKAWYNKEFHNLKI